MPPAGAAIPLLMGAGAAASGAGSIMSARSGRAQNVPVPPPNPLFPQANSQWGQQIGAAGGAGLSNLTDLANTGGQSQVGDVFNTMLASQQKLLGQGRAGLREQFGSMGLRHGSDFRNAAVDFENQNSLNFGNILAQLALQSFESSQNRRMGASGQLAELFGNTGMAFTPSSALVTGQPSALGAGLSSAGNSMSTLAILRASGFLK